MSMQYPRMRTIHRSTIFSHTDCSQSVIKASSVYLFGVYTHIAHAHRPQGNLTAVGGWRCSVVFQMHCLLLQQRTQVIILVLQVMLAALLLTCLFSSLLHAGRMSRHALCRLQCSLSDPSILNNVIIIIIIIIFVYYSCSQMLQPNQQLSRRTALIQQNRKQVYTTKHNTRFSTGILSCYIQIQALGSPQCRNLINTNRNNEYARILNTG